MSAKIYNGFTVNTDSAMQLMELVDGFRPYIHHEGQKMLNHFMRAVKNEDPLKGWRTWMDLRDVVKKEGRRIPAVDTDFQLVFFPDGNRFLGVAYTEHDRWFRRWLKRPLVGEYGYWDSADKPRKITRKEWNQRAADWDRLLGYHTPATRGFTIDLHETDGPFQNLVS